MPEQSVGANAPRHAGLAAAAGVLAGGLTFLVSPIFILGAVPLFFSGWHRLWRLTAACYVAGGLAGGAALLRSEAEKRVLFDEGGAFHAECLLRVEDSSATSWRAPGLSPLSVLRCRLLAFRRSGETLLRPGGGICVQVYSPGLGHHLFGEAFRLSGVLSPVAEEGVLVRRGALEHWENSGYFDSEKYARVRRFAGRLAAREAPEKLPGRKMSPQAYALDCRDRLMERMAEGMSDGRDGLLAAALFFGFRPGLDAPLRGALARAGTIHLFAVSGLHVGVAALLLYLFLRGAPFVWRQYFLAAGTGMYVLMTGMPTAGVRAWVMIAVFALLRAHLRYLGAGEILGWTAAGMLLWHPDWVFDAGFVYSFTLTLLLVASARRMAAYRKVFLSESALLPKRRRRPFWSRIAVWQWHVIQAMAACLTAGAGGALLSLGYQGLFPWSAAVSNFVLLPVVNGLFAAGAAKLLLSELPQAAWVLNRFLAGLFDLFETLATGDGVVPFPWISSGVERPDWWLIWLIAGGLLVFLLSSRRRVRRAALLSCLGGLAVAAFVISERRENTPRVHCLYGGGNEVPSLLLTDASAGTAVLVNIPSYQAAQYVNRVLRDSGLDAIDLCAVETASAKTLRGSRALTSLIDVRQFAVLGELPRRRAQASQVPAGALPVEKVFLHSRRAGCRIFCEKNDLHIEYSRDGSTVIRKLVLRGEPDRRELFDGAHRYLLEGCNIAEVLEL